MSKKSIFSKDGALKLAVIVLVILGAMDLIRGFMHTFNIWWASENFAHMSQTADTMSLMNTFGISNYLTGVIYLLIARKAKELTPYILMIIPGTYGLGIISSHVTGVAAMQTSAWNGKYMLFVYWAICLVAGINYFAASRRSGK